MTCSEIISKLKMLKKNINFFEQRKNDKSRVYKKLYNEKTIERFMKALEESYGNILPRPYWDKIDCIIEKLKDPDLEELGAIPFKKEFLDNL